MKNKIICSIVTSAVMTAMLTLSVSAEASSADTAAETAAITASITSEPAPVTTALAQTTEPTETGSGTDNSDSTESGTGEAATTELKDNPRLKEELNEDLYQYLMKYLDDPSSFEFDGQGVLIDESILNPGFGDENTEETTAEQQYNSHQTVGNGEKTMYTVATRDGSIFYIIVDKSGDTENVYFLNTVDITDLAAIIQNGKGEEDSYTPEEKEIIDKAGETVPINNENNSDVTNSNANTPVNNPDSSEGGESGDSSSALYIVVAVIGVAVIGFAAYKKIGPGKKKKADFDEVEDDEEEVVNDYVVDDDVVTSDYEDEAEETEELGDSDDM